MWVPLLMLLLCLEIIPAHAEIGSTTGQCISRYGQPERDNMKGSGLLYFRKDGICTIAHFYQGKCDVLSIFSSEGQMGVPDDLPKDRIQSLLKSEGGSPEWILPPRYSLNGVWCTPDRSTFAIYDTMRHKLAIMTHDAYMREQKSLAAVRSGNIKASNPTKP
jgi:hypothetical protein